MTDVQALALLVCALADLPPDCSVRLGPAEEVAGLILEAALDEGVDADVLAAVAWHESSFNPKARGSHGEIGLCQVLPATGRLLGFSAKDLRDPSLNLHAGARLLAQVRARCPGPPWRWLSVYNGRKCGLSAYSERITIHLRQARARALKELRS